MKIFLYKLLLLVLKTFGVIVFTVYFFRFLVYASGHLFGFYLKWQEITLTHEQRFFIHQLSDEIAFFCWISLTILLLVFPKMRKKFLFF